MRRIIIAFIGLAIILQANPVSAQQTDFNPERLVRIDAVINKHIEAGHIPGATALIVKNGEVVYNKAFGYADVEAKKKMQMDNIFRIASQSKAITTLAVIL